jgi:hypothetical protein
MTARHLLESANPISEETQNPQLNKRKITAKVLLGLTFVFLISSVPYHISEMYYYSRIFLDLADAAYVNESEWPFNLVKIRLILKLFLSINSCLNPITLFCTSFAFRRQFKIYLTCCCKAKSPPTDIELTRRK